MTAGGDPRFVLRWGRTGAGAAGAQAMAIVPGSTPALRFNSDLGVRYRPERLAEVPDNMAKVERLKAELLRTLDIFAKHPRQFVELYFQFVAERIEAEREALDKALAWSGGLFGAEDWIFAALRPLPLAAVQVNEGPQNATTVVFDFAFWTGRQVLAIELRGSARNSRKTAEQRGFSPDLVKPIAVPVAALAGGTEVFADSGFPPEFSAFWQGESVPSSPFRPVGLTPRHDQNPF